MELAALTPQGGQDLHSGVQQGRAHGGGESRVHEEPVEHKQRIPCVGAAGLRGSIGPPTHDGRGSQPWPTCKRS